MVGNLTQKGIKLKRIFIEPKLPEPLHPLLELASNLWWSWNVDASALFHQIEPATFEKLNYNPIALLDELSAEKAQALCNDPQFIKTMKRIHAEFRQYLDDAPAKKAPQIGYFCMEYGLHQSMRLYSGGLGVLAGDYLKEVSDTNTNLVAIGLLYRYGYFQQSISLHGEQIHHLDPAKFTQLPLHPVRDERGEWLKIHINLSGRTVWAKVWELQVGRVPLYLLDTDIEDNIWEDRSLTHQLYGGDNEHRLKQEILLGIGGHRALKAMKITPDIFHLNEGHAAFLGLERLSNYMKDEKMSLPEALEIVRSTQLFTTHTPVPAGHDAFPESMMRDYLYKYTYRLDLTWEKLMGLGRVDVNSTTELFSVSNFAIKTSQEVNGVSRLHGVVSQKMFNELDPDYNFSESHIGYVTNSVHFPTWVAPEWLEFYNKLFGKKFIEDQTNPAHWAKIFKAPGSEIMGLRTMLKKRLLDWVRETLQADLTRRGENPRAIFEVVNALKEDALVIGFARRFATYKRANLLFTNEKRLADIVNNTDRPVLFLFAGKAHPADKGGQEYIRLIYNTTQNPLFKGRVIFMENYGMEMAKLLVQGVDIWLNNPTRPKEASGTSGMKAIMNGVMNFSVLDGWWCEGYRPGAGWALPEKNTYADAQLQNELDAETIYNLLENDIIPAFFERDEQGLSERWLNHIRNTIAYIAPQFTMTRMLNDYKDRFYNKLWTRSQKLKAKDYAEARAMAAWKARIRRTWEGIELESMDIFDSTNKSLPMGDSMNATISLNLKELSAADIGLELVFFKRISETEMELVQTYEVPIQSESNGLATYSCHIQPNHAGVFEYGIRMYPKHPLLPHRQDFGLVRWF